MTTTICTIHQELEDVRLKKKGGGASYGDFSSATAIAEADTVLKLAEVTTVIEVVKD